MTSDDCKVVLFRTVYRYIFLIMMDIYDNFVSVGEIYCDGCAALFVITMYVRLLTWSKHNLIRLDC